MSTAATIAFVPRACASRASLRTVARPMPLAAPVTSTRMVILLEIARRHFLAARAMAAI
jgi:hypothetical protein